MATARQVIQFCILAAATAGSGMAEPPRQAENEVGAKAQKISYPSAADDTEQLAMFYAPPSTDRVPLLVALHTWSGDYRQDHHQEIEDWCVRNGWAYIHPDFRGPNQRPEATGSDLVVADIVSAVDYAKATTKIDASAIYLVGTSGGGHAALLMAGREPDLWAGVSAWVPISDLAAWYHECKKTKRKYYQDLELSCGGAPGHSPAVDREYKARSPLSHLKNAKGVRLHINAGIRDGHTGSVPISHSLLAFNEVAKPADRLPAEDIRFFVEKAAVPPPLRTEIADPSYGKRKPLFRRTSGAVSITIFDGGHELVAPAAISWFQQVHRNSRKPTGDSHSTSPSKR